MMGSHSDRCTHLHHYIRKRHSSCQQRGDRFSDLEVHRTVFNLQNDVFVECAIERFERIEGLTREVLFPHRVVCTIDESAPYYKGGTSSGGRSVRFKHSRKHIGPISLGAVEGGRADVTFAIMVVFNGVNRVLNACLEVC